MKINLLFFLFLCFFSLSFSQALPELPMKKNKIHYEFEVNLDNKNKSLEEYYNLNYQEIFSRFKIIINPELNERKISLTGTDNYPNQLGFIAGGFNTMKPNSYVDKPGVFKFSFSGKGLKIIDFTIVGVLTGSFKKRVLNTEVDAETELKYTSKNSYSLVFKKFTLNITHMDMSNTILDLSEYYVKLKEKKKISKADMKLFVQLDEVIRILNAALKDSFKYIIDEQESN